MILETLPSAAETQWKANGHPVPGKQRRDKVRVDRAVGLDAGLRRGVCAVAASPGDPRDHAISFPLVPAITEAGNWASLLRNLCYSYAWPIDLSLVNEI